MSLTEEQKTFFTNSFGDFWSFIEKYDFERDLIFYEMEKEYQQHGIYSIGPWFGRLINFLVQFGNVKSALEFGTATGYSAIWIAKDLPEGGLLTTIECDRSRLQLARKNISKAGLESKIKVREGEAQDIVSTLTQTFDFIFVDCAHFTALEGSERLLRKGGLFVCDNVGFRNKETFNHALTTCAHLQTLFLQCYLKGRIPENTAFSISIKL
ncbi:MAG: O-methyltransferase [Candidatus Bipolaricaulia bacterium]